MKVCQVIPDIGFAQRIAGIDIQNQLSGMTGQGRGNREPGCDCSTIIGQLNNVHILVVADEDDARRLLVKVLEQSGATVQAASSAREALEVLTRQTPEVLVSDQGMPDDDGFDLIRHARATGLHFPILPAVALTAFASMEDERAALSAGFQVHLSKPVDPKDVIAVIASLTGKTH